jgi:DNA-binding transcriptional ArsR family regulator
MDDDKITLDKKTFKTLASDTRVGILKSLNRRRKMLTEISKEFGMSPSTIKEHLDNLSGAGLVVMKDDGHKWKYYELTRKGKEVLNPGETKIWIVLALSAIAILITSFDFVAQNISQNMIFSRVGGEAMSIVNEVSKAMPDAIAPVAQGAPMASEAVTYVGYALHWHVISFVVFSVILGVSIGYVLAKKRFYGF